jgi:uncharacterized membrane protein
MKLSISSTGVFKIKPRIVIGLIGSLIVCVYGVYRLFLETPSSNSLGIPIIFAISGLIGIIGFSIKLRKKHSN